MIGSVVVLALVTAQRVGEMVVARRHTRALMARGAVEIGAGHYPYIVLMHAAWLAGLWWLAWRLPIEPVWLGLFVLIEAARVWVLATLGERWTTRVIILPGAPLVRSGPYRFFSHPNYVVVAAEILVLPLTFHLVWYAMTFSVLNAAAMFLRLRVENRGLAAVANQADQPPPRAL